MARVQHTYRVQVLREDGWATILEDRSRLYCWGYLEARRTVPSPRLAHRLVRDDDKIVAKFPARDSVSLGMVAGFPTPEQYERAAEEALRKAATIREERESRGARRDKGRCIDCGRPTRNPRRCGDCQADQTAREAANDD